MASTNVVTLTVKNLSKYGFFDEKGGVFFSKKFNESEKMHVVPGAQFEGEVYVADSGARYLNKVLKTLHSVTQEKHVEPKKEAPKAKAKPSAKDDAPMTRTDWDAKDRRISRQGVIQAAAQALTGVYPTVDELYEAAEALANKMLEFVNK